MGSPTSAASVQQLPSKNSHLNNWVNEMARLTKPEKVVWCDGSEQERRRLTEEAVAAGILLPLNQQKLPGCFLHRSNPNAAPRAQPLTFTSSPPQNDARPP